MRLSQLLSFALGALICAPTHAQSVGEDERVQIGTYRAEASLAASSANPVIDSVIWDSGDLRVRITQAAPCGYDVANPDWAISGKTIILRYGWFKRGIQTPDATALCLQKVQAWVFRVPDRQYKVLIDDWVGRYATTSEGIVLKWQPGAGLPNPTFQRTASPPLN